MAEKNRDLLSENNIGGTVIVGMEQLLPHIERIVRKVLSENQTNTPVQLDPNAGLTRKQVMEEFGVSSGTIQNRKNEGLLEQRGKGGKDVFTRANCIDVFWGDRAEQYRTPDRRKKKGE